jgi:riboflavin synthase
VKRIGVIDTTFARADMAGAAVSTLKGAGTGFVIRRRTVPGIKDLPVACRQMFRDERVDLCLALGMPGKAAYDKTCAHEASTGLIHVGVLESKPILECFVFEDEATTPRDLAELAQRRASEHALNAYSMLFRPQDLARRAGQGLRQGRRDAGPARAEH